jgi:tetratricopeptide (TPR) repeat protein
MHGEACEATRVRGDQSEDVMTLRMVCLDARLREMRALSDLFARGERDTIEHAVASVAALEPLSACADLAALTAPVRPPSDAATRARLESLRTRLAEARVLADAGRAAAANDAAIAALDEARAIGFRPAIAEALLVAATAEQRTGDFAAAEQSLREATWTAEAAHDDEASARAWVGLAWTVGYREARYDEGMLLARQAAAAVERAGGRADVEGELESTIGNILYSQGKYEDSLTHARRAIELREKALGPEHPSIAAGLQNMGAALATMGRFDEALVQLERARDLRERVLGRDHPDLGNTLTVMAIVERRRGRYDEAIALYERARAILGAAYGEEHPSYAMCLNNLAFAQTSAGKHAEALVNAERALAINTKRLGSDHPELADALDTVAHALVGLGRAAEAIPKYERAIAIVEKASGAKHPNVAKHLTGLGLAYLALGRAKDAIVPLERALAIRSAPGIDPKELAETRDALSRARAP